MAKKKKVLLIIPAYNEEKTIGLVIDSIRKLNKSYHIVVIDDGSTDKTADVSSKKKVKVLQLVSNLGVGGAVQTGIKYAAKKNYDVAVQIDADGQHNPKYVPKLLRSMDKKKDLVIGSRFISSRGYKSSIGRRAGILLISSLIHFFWKEKIYDITSGFRVFNREAILFLSRDYPVDCPEPASVIRLIKNGFETSEVPVRMNKRLGGKSYLTPFKSVYYMCTIILTIVIEKMRK